MSSKEKKIVSKPLPKINKKVTNDSIGNFDNIKVPKFPPKQSKTTNIEAKILSLLAETTESR